jgi:hypothetical protein
MVLRFFNNVTKALGLFLIFVVPGGVSFAQDNVVIQWNNAALQTIRYRRPWATINARALAIVHTCMYDAWAAYDEKALATILGSQLRRPARERAEQNKITAISFAAYDIRSAPT